MIGNILLFLILVVLIFIFIVIDRFTDVFTRKMTEIMVKLTFNDYKSKETVAEERLAEDDEEAALYKNDKGDYSYGAYAKNKRKKEALERGEIFIDDFEEAAVKSERKNPYAR